MKYCHSESLERHLLPYPLHSAGGVEFQYEYYEYLKF